MAEWTPMDEIDEMAVLYLNGECEEIKVNVIVCNAHAQPLWITYLDVEGREVIILANVVQKMTILSRRPSGINGVQVT